MICGSQFPRWVQQSPPFDTSSCVTNKIYHRDGMWLPRWGHKEHCVASVLLFLGSLALGGCQLPCQEQATLWRGLWGGEWRPPSNHQEERRPPAKSYPSELGRRSPSLKSSDDCSSSQEHLNDNLMRDPELEPPTTQKLWNSKCFKSLGFRATCYIAIG